ncbi:MAG: hydroxyphenylacetyl-CoA thioesterase PaaI [Gammaproteobacteria bacterium]|jgi:acyl-CoA thioesterase|nr:hydroxyphenylacetyl-CoA thioesterase PaaI [Gammaproteobacteria bacterium]MDH3750441.1 hydroxyphenylacetyl-CoA thioesterase PaaI [Gammaproteobacteria bacterium]MDH3806376.1 hydroxyphenylacetyl-CoA thioesterase PaaI [Gammaproteobacteria bacterium]
MDELERARACADKMYANDKASKALGIEVHVPEPGSAIATMRVRDDMVNGFDICHGGLVFTLADSAFAFACNAYDDLTVAGSGHIEFLRPVKRDDDLRAVAREELRGERVGFYTVEVLNQDKKIVALFRGRSVSRAERLLDS